MSTRSGPSSRRRMSSSWDNFGDTAAPEKPEEHENLVSLGSPAWQLPDSRDDGDIFNDDGDVFNDDSVDEPSSNNTSGHTTDKDDHVPRERLQARSLPGRSIENRSQHLPRQSRRLKNVRPVCYKTLHSTGARLFKFPSDHETTGNDDDRNESSDTNGVDNREQEDRDEDEGNGREGEEDGKRAADN